MGLKDLLKQGIEVVKDAAEDKLDDLKMGIEDTVETVKGVKADLVDGAASSACPICGGRLGTVMTRIKLGDENSVCINCWSNNVPKSLWGQSDAMTLEDMKKIAEYRKDHPLPNVENTGFKYTHNLGDFFVDEGKLLFAIAKHKEGPQPETLVYSFSWIVSVDVEFDSGYVDQNAWTVSGTSYLNIEFRSSLDMPPLPFEFSVFPMLEKVELEYGTASGTMNTFMTKMTCSIPPASKNMLDLIQSCRQRDV